MREYEVGIKREKSALDNFAEKYIIDGKLEIIPIDYRIYSLIRRTRL